jgi:succinyl-diaminopimelate desuccinylase
MSFSEFIIEIHTYEHEPARTEYKNGEYAVKSLEYEINLLSKLVECNTDAQSKRDYEKCAEVLVQEAEANALTVEIIDGEKGAHDGLSRPNVIVTLDAGSDTTLLLEAHFDIVPPGPGWTYPPFKLTVTDDRAYGRGAADNKSGIVAAFGALRQLVKENIDINISLIASVDEEIGGQYGVDYVLNQQKLIGNAALVLDAGPERLSVGASGLLWGKIAVKGVQGHAGYPFKADNAIDRAMSLMSALQPYRDHVNQKTSKLYAPPHALHEFIWGRFTFTMIQAGEKENIIPGHCEIRFDRRLLPEEAVHEAEQELQGFFERAKTTVECNASLDITTRLPGYLTSPEHHFVHVVKEQIEDIMDTPILLAGELGGNDGTFFANHGIPVVCFGPIRADTNYHGVNEFVYLDDLRNVRDLIINLGKTPREQLKK